MTGRLLQKHYCVTALQHWLAYKFAMSLTVNERPNEPVTPTRRADRRRPSARSCRAGLVATALIGAGLLAAACGGGPSGGGVATLGTTTTTTASAATQGGSVTSRQNSALAYVACMRTHGEPNMPEPNFSGGHVSVNINASGGVNPNSPQFTAATKACKHLLPKGGSGASSGTAFTAAEQADYLKAVACMRSHGISNFPDPTFQGNNVAFNTTTPINTNTSQYERALATCEKLIPAGLPYSSPGAS
jgi:hypothetical protein